MGFLAALFFVLALGCIVLAYGTATKNRWGINLDAISCPRCKTCLPKLGEPRSLSQALWGGCTCPVCGAGVDKWGREVAPTAPRAVFRSQDEIRRAVKKKAITITALAIFCLTIFSYWLALGESGRSFLPNWKQVFVLIVLAMLSTAFWTAILAVVLAHAIDRVLSNGKPCNGSNGKPCNGDRGNE